MKALHLISRYAFLCKPMNTFPFYSRGQGVNC